MPKSKGPYLSHKFRLYPNKAQEVMFEKNVGCCRFVYNWFLARRIALYEKGKKVPGLYDMIKYLPELRKQFPWLKEVDQESLRGPLVALDFAYKQFFKQVKEGRPAGFPRFKSKAKSKESFTCTNTPTCKVDVNAGKLHIPKHKWINARGDFSQLSNDTKIQKITVSKDSDGNWYASLLVKQLEPAPEHIHEFKTSGIDLGVKKPLAVCIETFDNKLKFVTRGLKFSKDLAKKECRRKHYQRQYARKQKGSKNQQKAQCRLGKAFYRERQFRKNWIEQTAFQLASSFETVVFEDLRLSRMTRQVKTTEDGSARKGVAAKSGLNRELTRLGLSSLMLRTEQKAAKYHGKVVYVNPKFTSQTCACCGSINKESRKSQAIFECVDCGHTANADYNAAENILNLGLASLAI